MLPNGTRLGPYQIIAPLGRGGMGEVYRARDLRLEREVAVKVVPEPFASHPDRLARFEREARAVAALAHPNVLVLYDIGSEEGIPFVVTELLEGGTLRGRLAGAAMPWREALEIGAAVAEGLAAAHGKGIIHRDIKPENLFLTADGRVKVLDFGLARLVMPASDEFATVSFDPAATAPGMVLGTVGYMSPEQVSGQPADARSDVFSLGCVLYEMVAVRRPFQGRTAAAFFAAVLNDDPPRLAGLGAKAPPEVERVIRHCLAREPGRRFSSARDLAFALRALLSGSGADAPAPRAESGQRKPRRRREVIPSLAVLPLANANVDPETEYLSDGITESIISSLSQLPGLRVMARSTVFRYKGQEADPQEVGRALKVRAVLTGRLFQRGNRLIIKVELVDSKDGSQLWGEQYHRELSDVPTLEKVIAREIAQELRLRLTGEQKRRLGQPLTESTEAWQCYLKGRYHWNKRSEAGLQQSIKLFGQAIDLDPAFAAAYSGVADAYLNLGGWAYIPSHEAYPRAKAAALRALAIDDGLAEAHVSLAMVLKEYEWDWPGAGAGYERALALNPNYPIAHQWHGEYLAALGRHDEAIAAFRRAIDLDPLSLVIHATLGRHGYYFARRYEEAIAQLQKTLEMDGTFWVAHHWLGWTYANIGRFPEAFAEFEQARQGGDTLEIVAVLGHTYGLAGRAAEARQALEELRQHSRTRYLSPMLPALVLLGLREYDATFEWLDRAVGDQAQMLSELHAEPAFDPLRADPRYADLMRRVGLAASVR